MINKRILAVIGAGFGDEGKGLAVDHFCSVGEGCLVVRHNGGAQAGHTVKSGEKRFVFHQLSSGSFRRADTYMAETFLPDLFKIEEEISGFAAVSGHIPVIFGNVGACITIIDDVLLNMALETSRGKNRHGSCGMGINEAVLRSEAGFGITLGEVCGMSAEALERRLSQIRREYVYPRLSALGLDDAGEYSQLIRSARVTENAAEGILRGAEYITPSYGLRELAGGRERIVFEGAQGLLLDSENKRFSPHVTASRTGIRNPMDICRGSGLELDTAVYVMRSYVTRHGAGPLPCECEPGELGEIVPDKTNVENQWQGRLRYGFYESAEELAERISGDLSDWKGRAELFITHLNETRGRVKFRNGDIPAQRLYRDKAFGGRIDGGYLSYSEAEEPLASGSLPCRAAE